MTKPKTAERPGITIHLAQEDLDELDLELKEAQGKILGARLHRSTLVADITRAHLRRRREQREATPAPTQQAAPAPPARPARKKAS